MPVLDFFGLPHGRPVAYASALTSVHEGRGFNAYIPMPFRERLRIELTNHVRRAPRSSTTRSTTRSQRELPADLGYLHVSLPRARTRRRHAPGLRHRRRAARARAASSAATSACACIDAGDWYGEGEVKVYRDGDDDLPTICGTGLEDYVGTRLGHGRCTLAPYGGAPLDRARQPRAAARGNPDFVGFYRWHLPDPIMFERDLRVTIQQIGAAFFPRGQEAACSRRTRRPTPPPARAGMRTRARPHRAWGIAERVDDYCATAYVYCREPQPVPRVDVAAAIADIDRRPYERASPFERMLAQVGG